MKLCWLCCPLLPASWAFGSTSTARLHDLKAALFKLELENNDFKNIAKELLESVHRLEIMITKMQK